ncbi:MAG: hypothetical protein ACPKPY_13045 [Nitrososphaeraceae archaeon]
MNIKYTVAIFSLLLIFLIDGKNVGESFHNVSAYTKITSENFEEIRDNLLEVRLSLQKGDLIEALVHLNNAEEELLLISSEFSNTSNNTTSVN